MILGPLQYRNHLALVRHMFRRAQHEAGHHFPDPRTQELQDRGAVLDWRLRVRRNEMRRGQ